MRKKLFIILLIITFILSAALLPACNEQEETVVLSARMDGAALKWSALDGASYYLVKCILEDGLGYSVKVYDTTYIAPYTTPGDYLFTVSALNESGDLIATSADVPYHLGTGIAADAITIGSAEDLMGITESFTLKFGKTEVASPVYYRLTADIDLTGKDFTPIGTSKTSFQSVFDGAGHTIKGLTFTKCNTDGNMGLFGHTTNAVIKNLNLEASLRFDKDSNTQKGELNCGLLIGHAVSTLIDNCTVKGDMDILSDVIKTDTYSLMAGGIVGKAESGRISCVSYTGNIKAQYGRVNAGGIVGSANGTEPKFMILNARAIANVSSRACAYNSETRTDYAIARSGVIAGNLSAAGRVASVLAIGTAESTSNNAGTLVSNLPAGVFGRTKTTDLGTAGIPLYNVYYSDNIAKFIGTGTPLGSYSSFVYPLSDEQMKAKYSYALEDGRYGLNFEDYWDMPDDDYPTLKGTAMKEQPSLTLTVHSDIDGHAFHYDFLLEDVMAPTYFDVSAGALMHSLGYSLDKLLDSIGTGITAVYTDDEIAQGVSVKVSADGIEDRILTTTKASLHCYLQYGVHSNYESREDVYSGYKLINAINSSNVGFYDYTTVDHITITFLPAGGTK